MATDALCIDLPGWWCADCAMPEGDECATCAWNGKWEDLLVRQSLGRIKIARGQLQQSLRTEAKLCCAVLLAFMDKAEGGLKSEIELDSEPVPNFTLYPELYPELPSLLRGRYYKTYYKFFTVSDDGLCAPGAVCIPRERLPSVNTGSEKSLEWAKRQIHKCTTDHEQCSRLPTRFLPSRLIHILPDDENTLVLRHCQDIATGTKYVALSHCWGEAEHWPQCITTTETLEQRMDHIPWDTVPKTFRDAIIFTRRLGLEYIWIDSVCIIQDDEIDWEKESMLMESVYSNAFLTLAAVASRDSRGGLFRSRGSEALLQLLTIRWKGSEQPLFAYFPTQYEGSNLSQHLDSAFVRHNGESHPLLTRAWTFQERLVSPRTLMFGTGQLLLECCSGRIAEIYWPFEDPEKTFPGGQEVREHTPEIDQCDTVRKRRFDGTTEVIRRRYAEAISNPRVEHMTFLWRDLVEIYSCMDMTKPTDRLPAISAVTKQLQAARSPDEYICGVWQESLHEDILWRGESFQLDLPIAADEPYVAPSWSWASYPASVRFRNNFLESKIQLIKNAVKPEYGDLYGRVLRGSHILVRGTVLKMVWTPVSMRPNDVGGWPGSPDWGLAEQQSLSLSSDEAKGAQQMIEIFLDYSVYNNDWYAQEDRAVVDNVCLLHVAEDTHTGEIRALVLHQDPKTGRYRRIGGLREMFYYSAARRETSRSSPGAGPELQTAGGGAMNGARRWAASLSLMLEQHGRVETIALE